jgi:hypothetical protein
LGALAPTQPFFEPNSRYRSFNLQNLIYGLTSHVQRLTVGHGLPDHARKKYSCTVGFSSDLCFFRHLQCEVHLNAKVSDGTFQPIAS